MSLTCVAHRMTSSISSYASKMETLKTSPCSLPFVQPFLTIHNFPNVSCIPTPQILNNVLSPWNVLACQPPFPRVLQIQIYSFIPPPPSPLPPCVIYRLSVGCHGVVSGCLSSRGIQSTLSVDNGFSALHPMNWHTQPFSAARELSCVV